MIDYLRRIASSSKLRALLPNAIPIAYAEDVDRFLYKDTDGTVRTLVQTNDTTPFAGVDGAVQFVEATISTAQVLALFGTPITLVAAAGAGKVLVPLRCAVILDYNSVAYNGVAAGEDLAIRYTDASGVIGLTVETTGFLDQASDQVRTGAVDAGAAAAIVPVANSPLVLHMTAGEIATGNSPLRVKLWYAIFSTGL